MKRCTIFWIFLVLIPAAFFTGCKAKLNGSVFLDENGNSYYDEGETKVALARYEIYRDNKLIKSGKSSMAGDFQEQIDEPGYYCVEVPYLDFDNPLAIRIADGTGEPPPFIEGPGALGDEFAGGGAAKVLGTSSPEDTDGNGILDRTECYGWSVSQPVPDEDRDGTGDICDEDPDNDAIKTMKQKQEEKPKEDEKVETPEPAPTIAPKKVCGNSKEMAFDIPVLIEIGAAIEQAGLSKEFIAEDGKATIQLPYIEPPLCITELVRLPSILFNEGQNFLDVNSELITHSLSVSVDPKMNRPLVQMKEFDVFVDESLDSAKTFEISMKMKCANREEIDYKVNIVADKAPERVRLTGKMLSDGGDYDVFTEDPITIEYEIENKGSSDLKDVVLRIDVGLLTIAELSVSDAPGCFASGTSVVICEYDNIIYGGSKKPKMKFKLMDNDAIESRTIEGSLTYAGSLAPIQASSVSVTIRPLPDTDGDGIPDRHESSDDCRTDPEC